MQGKHMLWGKVTEGDRLRLQEVKCLTQGSPAWRDLAGFNSKAHTFPTTVLPFKEKTEGP